MTGAGEESDGDTPGRAAGPGSDSPPERTSDSRYDTLFDWLDGANAGDRAGNEDNSEPKTAETDSSPPDTETGDAEADSEGWVWGSTKQASGNDPDPGAGAARETERQSRQSPDVHTDRIWNADLDELLDVGGSGRASLRDRTDTTEREGDESGRGDESAGRRTAHDKEPEPTESGRWSELGSDLGKTDFDPSDLSDEQPDEPQWERTDRAASSEQGIAGTAPLSNDEHSAVLDQVTDSASVLLLGPTDHPVADTICSRFVVGDEGSRNCLFVTFQDDPNDRIDVCHHANDWTGGDIGVIEVGRGRGASETTTSAGGGSITVRHVSNPGDLSKLGIVITQLLAEFDETPQQTALCFHTLSALHNQVGTKTLFRFLNTLQSRLRSSNAVGHYHMDPELHDEIVIETLRPIFDSVVRYSADGDLSVE